MQVYDRIGRTGASNNWHVSERARHILNFSEYIHLINRMHHKQLFMLVITPDTANRHREELKAAKTSAALLVNLNPAKGGFRRLKPCLQLDQVTQYIIERLLFQMGPLI